MIILFLIVIITVIIVIVIVTVTAIGIVPVTVPVVTVIVIVFVFTVTDTVVVIVIVPVPVTVTGVAVAVAVAVVMAMAMTMAMTMMITESIFNEEPKRHVKSVLISYFCQKDITISNKFIRDVCYAFRLPDKIDYGNQFILNNCFIKIVNKNIYSDTLKEKEDFCVLIF